MTKKYSTRLTPEQCRTINVAMSNILYRNGEYWEYRNDMTDAKLAAQHGVNEKQIARFRGTMFGKLKPASRFMQYGELVRRMVALEARVDALIGAQSGQRLFTPVATVGGDARAVQR